MIHSEDPHNPHRNKNRPAEPSAGPPPGESDATVSSHQAFNLGPLSFAPGEITLVPDEGMTIPLGKYSLVDCIDGVLITRVPAPYDERVSLIDVSELASLVHRLDAVSIPLLGGATVKELYPPGWSQSIDEINLAFEDRNDPFSERTFEEIGVETTAGDLAENADCSQFAVKLGRFVESLRALHEYLAFQKSRRAEGVPHRDLDTLDTFLSQAMGRACARSMRSS
jgi:hypothetical protein